MKLICPFCGNEFKPVNNAVFRRVETSGGPSNIKTKCCGKIVRVRRSIEYTLVKTLAKEDDWGNTVTATNEEK